MVQSMGNRIAVDIGGTFVDAVVHQENSGNVEKVKSPTTPENPSLGVQNAIDKLTVDLSETEIFFHGTTLGVNALIEGEQQSTGLITNEGFQDVLELGRYNRPPEDTFKYPYQKPDPLIKKRNRKGVPGRLNEDGEVLEPLDSEAVNNALEFLIEDQLVDSIAVFFLHSYQNPVHEKKIKEIINEKYPDVHVSISSDITREYREYERVSTTVADAQIKPIFVEYINNIQDFLSENGFSGSFLITRSGGGAMYASKAKSTPIHTLFSGPAGGLIGTSYIADTLGNEDLIATDMGGTSLDTCIIRSESPAISYETKLDHLDMPVMIPVFDIRTIGAGGGSIAWVDNGLPEIGPMSAGADPGPICYGRGGEDPTLTDIALKLGFINPDGFLGGDFSLSIDKAFEGIEEKLANPLGVSVEKASVGIFELMRASTVSAIREITVEKGFDPRDFSIVAYGGAGPMIMPIVAQEMDIGELIIPPAASVFSAWGMMMANVKEDYSQTVLSTLNTTDWDEIKSKFDELEKDARSDLSDQGFDEENQNFIHSVEMRYIGQEHTVDVEVNDVSSLDQVYSRFSKEHKFRYGHEMDDPAEIVHIRVRGVGDVGHIELTSRNAGDGDFEKKAVREAYCFSSNEFTEFNIYDRSTLNTDSEVQGPAIIEESANTIVLQTGQSAGMDKHGNIVITEGM